MNKPARPLLIYPLCVLHAFLGFSAICGGLLLINEPDGASLGMNTSLLANSPFSDFLLPGIMLAVFLGLLPSAAFLLLIKKLEPRYLSVLNIYASMRVPWAFSIYTGLVCLIWIIVQQTMIGYFWIQSIIGGIGLLILVCTLAPDKTDK